MVLNAQAQSTRFWTAPVDFAKAPAIPGRFDVISIVTPEGLIWWGLKFSDPQTADPGAEFASDEHCVADSKTIKCFIARGTDIRVRTCADKVTLSERQQYLQQRLSEVKEPLAWALLDSYERLPLRALPGLAGTFFPDFLGPLVPATQIEHAKKNGDNYELKLRQENGKMATIVLSDDLKAVSAK